MVFQWFPMVANHWSDDGMVTIHRSGLEPTTCVVIIMRGGGWDFGAVGGNEVELSSVLDLFYFTHYTLQCPHQAFSDRQLSFRIQRSRKVSLVKLWYKSNAECKFFSCHIS